MAVVGCLGEIVFSVSSEEVKTFENMKWNGSARYGTHARHRKKALTEFTGLDPDTISFDLRISIYLGVEPMEQLTKIRDYESKGKAVALVVGDEGYGDYKWTISSHKVKMETHDQNGNLTGATVAVSLLEYLRR